MRREEEFEIYLQGIKKVPQSSRDEIAPSEFKSEDKSPGVFLPHPIGGLELPGISGALHAHM